MKKLSNEKFVSGAPAQVVENERKKQADAEAKIKAIDNNWQNWTKVSFQTLNKQSVVGLLV